MGTVSVQGTEGDGRPLSGSTFHGCEGGVRQRQKGEVGSEEVQIGVPRQNSKDLRDTKANRSRQTGLTGGNGRYTKDGEPSNLRNLSRSF